MNIMKRLGCLLLSVAMALSLVLSCLPVPGGAAEATDATVMVESTNATAGATVEVDLLLSNNPGIAGARLTVSYHEQLELIDAVCGEALSALDYTRPGNFRSPCTFNWDSESGSVAQDGVLLTLTFRVSREAVTNTPLNVDVSYRYGDIYNAELEDLTCNMVGGHVTVLDYLPGDVNGDGTVNGKDVTLVRRYNASGYEVTINEAAADVNADGLINGKDVTLIRRYVAGGYDVKLQPSAYWCTHSLTEVEAQAPTCTREGNIAHWRCENCQRLYADADAVIQLTQTEVLVEKAAHTPVTDPAKPATMTSSGLTEGSHCGVCQEVLVPQEVIPPLTGYAITYYVANGDPYLAQLGVDNSANPMAYVESDEPIRLVNLKAPAGYKFLGWFNGSGDNATQIKEIPANSTGDMKLWAHWELIEYTITYDCGTGKPAAESPTTYTVADEIELLDPELHYYFFTGWTDEQGEPVEKIPQGTTGNRTFTAHWKTMRSQAKPVDTIADPKYDTKMFVQDGDQYTYIYYLGCIERVPFGGQGTPYEHTGLMEHSVEFTTSEATASSISTTVSKVTEESRGWQTEVSAAVEVGYGCPVGAQGKLSVEVSNNQSGSTSTTTGNEQTTTISQETVSSTTKRDTIEKDFPVGWYRWVHYATVDVFAAVTYDVSENKYYVANINAVRDVADGWDYSFKSGGFDDQVDTELPFPGFEEIEALAASFTAYTEGLVFAEDSWGEYATVVAYDGEATDVVIPTYYINSKGQRVPVTGIKAAASEQEGVFAGKNITSVILGANVTDIPNYAFYNCDDLTSVQTLGQLKTIGDYAFYGCRALEYELPDSVTSIGTYAFAGCEKLDAVKVSKNVTKVGEGAFMDCGELDITAIAAERDVLKGLSGTNAANITIDMSAYGDGWADVDFVVPDTVENFVFEGKGNFIYLFDLESHAKHTVIRNMEISDTHLQLYSPEVTLNSLELWANDGKPAVQFYHENAQLLVGNEIRIDGAANAAVIVCSNLDISSIKGVSADVEVTGRACQNPGNAIEASGAVCFSGYMDVELNGSDGSALTSAAGASGSHGAAAICAKELTININGSFEAFGGDGGNGRTGTTYDGVWAEDFGRAGGDGGNGGNGAEAMIAEKLTIQNAGKLKLKLVSGTGGRGGDGGVGESSHYVGGTVRVGGRGGNAGQGGNGGAVLAVTEIICDGSLLSGEIYVGPGGDGGNGGRGGHADIWYHWLTGNKREWSNPGAGGSGNIGGEAGTLGFAIDALKLEETAVNYGHTGSKGSNGAYGDSDAIQ